MSRAKAKPTKTTTARQPAQPERPFTRGYIYKDDGGREVAGTADRIVCAIVGDMEDDLAAAGDLVHAVAVIAETVESSSGANLAVSLQRLAWTIKERLDAAEEKRGKISSLLNPHARDNEPDRSAPREGAGS
jgi:hypothetical protein